jgi:hypothetical protein
VQRQLSTRISWSDVHQDIVERRLFRLLVQQEAFLVGQDRWVVVGDDDPAIDPAGHPIDVLLRVVGQRKVLVDRLEGLRSHGVGRNSPTVLEVQWLDIESMASLYRRQMRHHAPENRIPLPIGGTVVVHRPVPGP